MRVSNNIIPENVTKNNDGFNKFIKWFFYTLISLLLTSSLSINVWAVKQVIDRPNVLAKYQTKVESDTIRQDLKEKIESVEKRTNSEISEQKTDMCKRIDDLQNSVDKRFDKIEALIESLRR